MTVYVFLLCVARKPEITLRLYVELCHRQNAPLCCVDDLKSSRIHQMC